MTAGVQPGVTVPNVPLVESDGEPLESHWHVLQISLLLEGWRLSQRRYRAVKPDERGWMWVKELGLWLGPWKGEYQRYETVWLRFYDAEGRLVPTNAEAAEAEVIRLKARLAELEAGQK